MKFCRLGLLQDALRMSLKKAARRAQTLGVSSRVFSPLQAIATAGAVMEAAPVRHRRASCWSPTVPRTYR
jgi:hypothetical protein